MSDSTVQIKNVESVVEKGFISYTDINRLLGELQDGESLVIKADGNHYSVFKAKSTAIKWDKLQNLAMRLTRNLRSKWQDAFADGMRLTRIHTTSIASPTGIVSGMKSSWELALEKPENRLVPIVDLFMDYLADKSHDEKFTAGIIIDKTSGGFNDVYYEITLPDYPVKIVVNKFGSARAYIHGGIRYEIQ